jgi:hypothetical protein
MPPSLSLTFSLPSLLVICASDPKTETVLAGVIADNKVVPPTTILTFKSIIVGKVTPLIGNVRIGRMEVKSKLIVVIIDRL